MEFFPSNPMPPNGAVRVVDEACLEGCTRDGWRLIQVLDETQVATLRTEERKPNANGYNHEVTVKENPAVVKKHRYLLHLDEKSAAAQAAVVLARIQQSLSNAHIQLVEYEREKAKTDLELVDLRKQQAQHVQRIRELEADVVRLRKTGNDLEEDLGAIREAIGAKQMKEILDAE